LGPLKRVVGDILPSVLTQRVVRAPWELLELGNGLGVAVVLEVGLVDRRWLEVVLPACYEK
jgi:hypothetical protein